MGFEDCLRNCCEQNSENAACGIRKKEDPMAGFKEPDLWRYFNAPMATDAWGALVSSVDFEYEETKNGVKVTQISSPLIPEPKSMGKLSSFGEMPPLRLSQQDADLGKRSGSNKGEDPSEPSNNRDFDSLKPLDHTHPGQSSEDKTEEGSRRKR